MKTFIALLLALLCLNVNAQNLDSRLDYSPYGLGNSMLSFKMKLLSHHGDATQVTYFDLNFVDQLMQHFVQNQLHMTIVAFPVFGKENGLQTLTIRYKQQATIGTTRIPYLIFKYAFFENKEKHPIIKSCTISGTSMSVVNFYVKYWPTSINFDVSKDKVAYNYLLQDKATIRVNANGGWTITIENTTIHDLKEYYRELGQNQTQEIQLETAYSIKTQKTNDSIKRVAVREAQIRDSLIDVARAYGIGLGNLTTLSPTTDWLRYAIRNTEIRLNSGNNYNYESIDSLIKVINSKLVFDKRVLFTGHLTIEINEKGLIYKAICYSPTNNMPQALMDTLSNFFTFKKIAPFKFANKTYSSHKEYEMMFVPEAMQTIQFSENRPAF